MFKKIPFIRRYSTKSHTRAWKNREVDWVKDYLSTWDHPHRGLIVWMLKSMTFQSLWEVGCGPGANIVRILKEITGISIGGTDINQGAIDVARRTVQGALFEVGSGDNILMSDKSVDILLTDMTLIYVGPFKIKDYLKEFARTTRNNIVLVEFDERNWWKRQKERMNGHHAHNYQKLLSQLGFYDILIQKIPDEFYPGLDGAGMRKIITAKPPLK